MRTVEEFLVVSLSLFLLSRLLSSSLGSFWANCNFLCGGGMVVRAKCDAMERKFERDSTKERKLQNIIDGNGHMEGNYTCVCVCIVHVYYFLVW